MRRRVVLIFLFVPLVAIMLFSALASARPTVSNTWAGVWNSDFGALTLDAGGSGSYTGFNPGTVSGSVQGNVDKGTWSQPGTPPKNGTFEFTMSGDGRSFAGTWAYAGGGCGSACGWNGTCQSGACLKNGAVATTTTTTPPRPSAAKVKAAVAWTQTQVGSSMWTGRCERFVEAAYGARTGYASAAAAARRIGLRSGPVASVPRGALIYFRPDCPGATGGYGHVGIALGGGKMISVLGEVKVTDLNKNSPWRKAYSGWAYPPTKWPGRRP